jgi:hypothetical protein
MRRPKRKSPNGADPKLSATQQADAYHRRWLEVHAEEPGSPPSAEALANHEFVLALIRGGSLEYDPETDTFQRYLYC